MNPDMTMGEAISLVLIAQGETKMGGLTVTELSFKGSFALSSASRHMKSLGKKDRRGNLGAEVVSDIRDPENDRRKILRLTSKGRAVVATLINLIGE